MAQMMRVRNMWARVRAWVRTPTQGAPTVDAPSRIRESRRGEQGVPEVAQGHSMHDVNIIPDSPIQSPDQDLLGRAGYAESLAKALINLVSGPGIVVGLNGIWGSGKSSIKNLILNEIRKASAPVEIVEFNPWQYESASQLTTEFFSEIAIAATSGLTDDADIRERRAKFWKYGSRVAKVGAAGLSALLPVVGVAVEKGTAHLVDQLGKVMEEAGQGLAESVSKKSLNEVKKELSDELRKLDRSILIVIDDIDRLDADEIKLLFKLVKANADFPNVSYLLIFARERVERALSGTSEDGAKFLEKIVTVAFDVPALTREDTLRIFENEVKTLLEDVHVSSGLEQDRWQRAKDTCIRPYLDTVRTVRRYTNMLRFLTGVYREDAGLNVNFVDLAVLEVIREFEPKVYEQLSHMGPMLTEGGLYFLMINNVSDEQRQAVFLDVVRSAKDDGRQPFVRAGLAMLFPQINWTTGDWTDNPDGDEDLRRIRITRGAYFSRYFGFDLRQGVFYESQFLDVIASAADAGHFRQKLEELSGDQFLHLMLLMAARVNELPKEHYVNVFETLYLLADGNPGSVGLPEGVIANALDLGLLITMISRVESAEDKKELIRAVAEKVDALAMPVALINREHSLRGEKTSEHSFLDDESFLELKGWALDRLRIASLTGRLVRHPALYNLLFIWGWLAEPDEPTSWIRSLANDSSSVKAYLKNAVAPKLKDRGNRQSGSFELHGYATDFRSFQSDLEMIAQENLEPELAVAVDYAILRNKWLNEQEQVGPGGSY